MDVGGTSITTLHIGYTHTLFVLHFDPELHFEKVYIPFKSIISPPRSVGSQLHDPSQAAVLAGKKEVIIQQIWRIPDWGETDWQPNLKVPVKQFSTS